MGFNVDWQRRRVMADGNSTHCRHGSRLIEFCPDCGLDLEAIASERCRESRNISSDDVYGVVNEDTGEAA